MEPPSLAPDHYRILSGSVLKLLAVISMFSDHVAKFILIHYSQFKAPLCYLGSNAVSICLLMESFGRLAFPIFCFLLVEGFLHTHDRRRYGARLLAFALISEIPFDLVRTLEPFDLSYQNVFFTLFLGYLGLCALDALRKEPVLRAISVLGLALASMALICDYGPRGYALVLILYVLRVDPLVCYTIGFCTQSSTWRAGLAFIPISLYNGSRGFIQGPLLKYLFYAFYPLHLLSLWALRHHLGLI